MPGKKNVIGDFLSRSNIESYDVEDLTMRDVIHSIGIKNIQFSEEEMKLYKIMI